VLTSGRQAFLHNARDISLLRVAIFVTDAEPHHLQDVDVIPVHLWATSEELWGVSGHVDQPSVRFGLIKVGDLNTELRAMSLAHHEVGLVPGSSFSNSDGL
jgi:hypothetical protein